MCPLKMALIYKRWAVLFLQTAFLNQMHHKIQMAKARLPIAFAAKETAQLVTSGKLLHIQGLTFIHH